MQIIFQIVHCSEMTTTGKTPISLLSETLVRQCIQPMYVLQQSAVGINQGNFVYEVVAGNVVTACGSGRSKKEAKQNAAKNALEILKSRSLGEIQVAVPADLLNQSINVISPYEAELKANQVGRLIEICGQHNIPSPEFQLIREDGPPHAKQFEYTVQVSKMVESAVGRTKQQAKQLAASNMLAEMEKLSLTEFAPKPEEKHHTYQELPNMDAIMSQYKEVKNDKPLGMKIGQGLMHSWTGEQVAFIQSFAPQLEQLNVVNLVNLQMLETICQELQLSFDVFRAPSEQKNIIICLVLSTTPESCFMAMGVNEEVAKDNSACKAIQYLQIMST